MDRAIRGDVVALAGLLADQRPRIVSLAAFFTGSVADAEDLAQDILLRLVQALPRLASPDTFDVWVYRLSRNRSVDHFRRRRFEAPWPATDLEPASVLWSSPAPRPDAALETSDGVRRLRRALRALPPTWRRAVALRDLEELSYEEVADRLGLPLGTVKSQISRGRSRLAAVLAGAGRPVSTGRGVWAADAYF